MKKAIIVLFFALSFTSLLQARHIIGLGDLVEYNIIWSNPNGPMVTWRCVPNVYRCFEIRDNTLTLYECGTNIPLRTFNIQDQDPIEFGEGYWGAYLE